jgi:starvation-inducible DNA-binding protein
MWDELHSLNHSYLEHKEHPMPSTASKIATAEHPVANALQTFLKDTYSLYLITHNYHWNVEGPKFFSLHTLFEQQYNELFAAIDVIAERIRVLDVYALPNHYHEIFQALDNLSNPQHKETDKDAVADRMVHNLIEFHEKVIASAQALKKHAAKHEDDESEDLAVQRIQVHQKAVWMLRSIVK